ncbi:hypothetical protein [Streptomyces pimonensis]|uniref:hypothetical protein n=1 Tax=Streptomyces pimonensis TaxID=2860288 RepID=UPI0035280854
MLDAVPLGEALRRHDAKSALSRRHWFFLAQTDKPAERIIGADPDTWYRGAPEQADVEAYEDYRRAVHDPATVHARCEDHRAGPGVDRRHDADRRAGRRTECPLLVPWAARDDMAGLYGDVPGVWRDRAGGPLEGGSVASGHHVAEEAPEALVTAPLEFWKAADGAA